MQYILITGASTGIGYTTTKYLIQHGYFVFGSVRKAADAQRLENEFGERFKALLFDVKDEDAIQKSKTAVEDILGSNNLTALINNAGIVVFGPLQHLPFEEFQNQFEVNVFGVLRVTQAFLPLLGADKKRKGSPGKIINISSVSGTFTNPFLVPYCASKFALESLTDGLRRELLIYGIDAISIQPGPIKTPIWTKAKLPDNQYDNTDYDPVLKGTDKMIAKTERNAIDPINIAQLIHKILRKRKPKTKYIIMRNSLPIRFVRLLPDRWVDKIFKIQINKILEKSLT